MHFKYVFSVKFFISFAEKKVIEYVEQYVTALVMIYSPTVNDTHYPLGTATTCSEERYSCANLALPRPRSVSAAFLCNI